MTEAAFTDQVLALARLCGWRTLHIRPGRTAKGWRTPVQGDGKGWPDVFAVRRERCVVAELKVGRGRLTAEQAVWLAAFRALGTVEVYEWRETDWDTIVEVLR